MRDGRVYLLAAYLEHLLATRRGDAARRVADASRYLRYLIAESGTGGITAFVRRSTANAAYGRRLERHLRHFVAFLAELEESSAPPPDPSGEAERPVRE